MTVTYSDNNTVTYGSTSYEVTAPSGSGGTIIGIPVYRVPTVETTPNDGQTDDYGTRLAVDNVNEMEVGVYAVDDTGDVDATWDRGGDSESGVFLFRIDNATGAADVEVATLSSGATTTVTMPTIAAANINDSDFVIITVATSNQGDASTHTSGNTSDTDFVEHHDADVGGSGWWAGEAQVCSWLVEGHNTSNDYTPSDVTRSVAGVRVAVTILVPVPSASSGSIIPALQANRNFGLRWR